MGSATEPLVIAASGFSKTFSGRTVLRGVDLTVRRGEIHALVGQNGSGKSTFIKILSGYHSPDPGASLAVGGRHVDLPLHPDSPTRLGLSFVHQDLGLFEDGTVLENLLVGRYRTGLAWHIDWTSERRRVASILADYGMAVHPDTPLRELQEVERTIVAIARAIAHLPASAGALLVLDEPTARLPHDSVDRLFETVRSVAARGDGVLFVSHRLDEVVALADRVTVLRDGEAVSRIDAPGPSISDLVTAIVGGSIDPLPPPARALATDVVMRARGVAGGPVADFSADIGRGEVLGLTGLLGMGHDTVPYLLFGARAASAGTLEIHGERLPLSETSPTRSMRLGVALLPSNRARDGGVGDATVRENMTLATLRRYRRWGILRGRIERANVMRLMERFDIQPRQPDVPLGTFSGGNQQKALIAKWLERKPHLLLLDEPTHGVDVGAKRQILGLLAEAAREGMSIVVASVEVDDLAQLCHRVLVMRHGRVVAELAGESLTAARIAEQTQLATATASVAA